MVTVEDFSRLVSGVYAAAVTPRHWEGAIRDIHRALGGTHAVLLTTDGANRSMISGTLAIEAGKSYTQYYHRLDYLLAAVERGPVGVVRTGSELTEPRNHREFHTDWARPYEGDDGLVIRLTGGARPTCFVVGAPRRSESFDTPERVKLMSGLVVHMQQALRTQNKLAILNESRDDLAGALDAIRHGIVIAGAGSQVMHLNSAAEQILRSQDGMQIRSGRVAATTAAGERQLHRAIHAALTGDSSDSRSGRSFTCQRPSGRRPYIIHVLPLHRTATGETWSGSTALVLIIDPEHETQSVTALLRQLYRFTDTESEIALRLARGADLKRISDELSISLTTVRTHLQHAFDKTNTHRQAELVQQLLAVSP
jgi:DNA-binding CsgD family transcriptional regulator/PAS domain-containing protein